ncbi:Cell division protein FtsY homolog, chloroplastic-like protein [Drosera capensis]
MSHSPSPPRAAASTRSLPHRSPSLLVRQSAAHQIADTRSNFPYSKPLVIFDLIWNTVIVFSAAAVLGLSFGERSGWRLRVWVVVYGGQCLVHVGCVVVEYRRRRRRGRGRSGEGDVEAGAGEAGEGSEEREYVELGDGESDDGDGDREDDSLAKQLESANTMFAVIWWIVGFYWVSSGGQTIEEQAPKLYWLCISFLALDVFFVVICVAVACLVGVAVCCCLPCIIAVLYAIADQEGATKDDIERLLKYKFRKIGDFEKQNGEIQESFGGIMTECGSEPPVEHVLSLEDAVEISMGDGYKAVRKSWASRILADLGLFVMIDSSGGLRLKTRSDEQSKHLVLFVQEYGLTGTNITSNDGLLPIVTDLALLRGSRPRPIVLSTQDNAFDADKVSETTERPIQSLSLEHIKMSASSSPLSVSPSHHHRLGLLRRAGPSLLRCQSSSSSPTGFFTRLGRLIKEKAKSDVEKIVSGFTKTRKNLAVVDELLLYWNMEETDRVLEELEEIDSESDSLLCWCLILGQKSLSKLWRACGKIYWLGSSNLEEALKKNVLDLLTKRRMKTDLQLGTRKPSVIMIVGVNGGGKTTSLGKLANRLKQEGAKVLMAAGDTFRAAASDQLEIWEDRTGCDIVVAEEEKAKAVTGLHTNYSLMEELVFCKKAIKKIVSGAPNEILLVLDGTTGLNMLPQAREFNDVVGVTGLILTKLDGSARGGCVVSVVDELGIPVKFVGVGEGVDDLQPFEAETFVDAIFS